jgi:hypothetical protein
VTGIGHDPSVTSSRGARPPLLPTRSTTARRAVASVVTVALAGGLMGLATFGRFDDESSTITRSVLAPLGAG